MRYTARIGRHCALRTHSPRIALQVAVIGALAMTPAYTHAQDHQTRYVAPTNVTVTTGWSADLSDVTALHLLADNGVANAQHELVAEKAAAAEQNATVGVHDVDLSNDDIAARGAKIVKLRAQPDSISLHVGQLVPPASPLTVSVPIIIAAAHTTW